jgi:endonuclease/exonuclease/phosphatase family metal-dependent hydrolase
MSTSGRHRPIGHPRPSRFRESRLRDSRFGDSRLPDAAHASGFAPSSLLADGRLRVATYNIAKGVRGLGPRKRLEIHNLGLGIEALDADLVFLQEVRSFHHREALRFERTSFGWPKQGQADFLAPEGYEAAYRTNAVTRHGEHGNALLSRWPLGDIGHHDVSDHPFEQRGLLHVPVRWQGHVLHAIVAHLGLIHASRVRQVERLARFIEREVPAGEALIVAGDFNDWGERLDPGMADLGLQRAAGPNTAHWRQPLTFPSRVPVFALDRIYLRGLRCTGVHVPRGASWARMSDHLPLVADLETT